MDKFGQDFPYEVPDGQLAALQAGREANRPGARTVELDSPLQKGVGLSSAMVVARAHPLTADADANDPFLLQGRSVVPLLDGSLKASANLMVFFVVYPDQSNQEAPPIRAGYFVNGEELEVKDVNLSAPGSYGAIPVMLNAASRAGKCEIGITAAAGVSIGRAQRVLYRIAVRAAF